MKTIDLQYLVIPPHASQRYHQRDVEAADVKKFIRYVDQHFCEMVFECIVYGLTDGHAKRMKIGDTRFVYTYDQVRQKLILKTMI